MSGGSYDYAYSKVEDMADRLVNDLDPLRRAFGSHLRLVSKAMHDIEWVDSCDYSPEGDHKSIVACLKDAQAKAESVANQQIIEAVDRLIHLRKEAK